jgi:hypothetical protein
MEAAYCQIFQSHELMLYFITQLMHENSFEDHSGNEFSQVVRMLSDLSAIPPSPFTARRSFVCLHVLCVQNYQFSLFLSHIDSSANRAETRSGGRSVGIVRLWTKSHGV